MSRHNHKGRKLRPAPPPAATAVPAKKYGALVGAVNGPLSDADDNHVYIPVLVRHGPAAGTYRIALNVESTVAPRAAQYCVRDETVEESDPPAEGFFADAQLSYRELGLVEQDFKVIGNGMLRTVVHSTADRADMLAAYGFTFPGGIHDIHYNNGEPPGSHFPNFPDQDGALAMYYRTAAGVLTRRWIFIKFQSQTL